jgi:RHS repeat-associated protein
VVTGSLNETGTVTIDGKPATVDGSNNFRGTAQLATGATTFTVAAKDASGNQTTQQYQIDTTGSATSYANDANGNLTSDGTKTYFWNARNQLVEVKQGATTLATFEYDGSGRRTEKTASGITHLYLYDAEDIAEEPLSGSSSDTIRYYHGSGVDEPLASANASSVVSYYLADHLGSVVQETSGTGSVTLDREYDPWGVPVLGSSTSGFAFTGREWDSEIGLYYYRARYYDSAVGRFVAEDPAGLVDGPNFSTYVLNRPTGAIDPTGNNTWILQWVPGLIATVATTATVATPPGWVVATVATVAIVGTIWWAKSQADDLEEGGDYKGFLDEEAAREAQKAANGLLDTKAPVVEKATPFDTEADVTAVKKVFDQAGETERVRSTGKTAQEVMNFARELANKCTQR